MVRAELHFSTANIKKIDGSAIGHGGEPDFERLLWLFSYALTNSHALKLRQEIAKIIRTSHSSSSTDHLDYFFLYLLLESEVLL